MKIEVLVGMIGSGKSTYARKRADEGALVVCHDDLTQMLHGRYRYEPGLKPAYLGMMRELVILGLAAGRDVVVDRTHLTLVSRLFWVGNAAACRVPVVAVCFPVFDPETHARRRFLDDPRGRPYEEWLHVARHHAAQFEAEPIDPSEGFTEIVRL